MTFGAESSQSRSHVTTTNCDFNSFSLTSITALRSSSSMPQSSRYVYLQVREVSRCSGHVLGMIRDNERDQRVMTKTWEDDEE